MAGLKPRKGITSLKPYPPGKPIEEVQREYGLKSVTKMASNENPLGASPKAVAALKYAAKEIYLYPDGNSYYLKKALSKKLKVNENQLTLGNGSDEIISFLAMAYIERDDEVIVSDKDFIEYSQVTGIMGGALKKVPVKNFSHDIKGIVKAVTKKTRAIMISNPCNPLGTMCEKDDIDYLVDNTPEDVLLVLDEAYYEYARGRRFPNSIAYIKTHPNVVVLRTFSKIYGLAGLRIGYAVAHTDLVQNLNRVRPPFNVNRMAQIAALAALDDQEHIKKTLAVNNVGKEYLYDTFEDMDIPFVPTFTNFILFDVERDGTKVFESMLKLGVIVRPMSIYGLPTCLRVTIGTTAENRKFISALRQVLGR